MDDLHNQSPGALLPGLGSDVSRAARDGAPVGQRGAGQIVVTPGPTDAARVAVEHADEAIEALLHTVAELGEDAAALTPEDLEWLVTQTQRLVNRQERV